jgi:hypothetical protein
LNVLKYLRLRIEQHSQRGADLDCGHGLDVSTGSTRLTFRQHEARGEHSLPGRSYTVPATIAPLASRSSNVSLPSESDSGVGALGKLSSKTQDLVWHVWVYRQPRTWCRRAARWEFTTVLCGTLLEEHSTVQYLHGKLALARH